MKLFTFPNGLPKSSNEKEIALIAHDLRGPLMVFKALTENQAWASGEFQELAAMALQRMSEIIDGILKSPEKIYPNLIKNECDPFEVISNLIAEKRLLAGQVSFQYSSVLKNLPALAMTKLDFANVISAVLDNAIDAIKSTRRDGNIKCVVQAIGSCLRICISDNGTGIPAKNISSVGKKGFTLKSNGHGLGIYSVIRTLESYNGRFEIKSSRNHGTSVTIEIPICF